VRNLASIGSPFGNMEYMSADDGELLVKGKARAARILVGGEEHISDLESWFSTSDLVSIKDGRYYHNGRKDDLVVGSNGENLNPTLIEPTLLVDGCTAVCLISDAEGDPLLLASAQGCYSVQKINEIYVSLDAAIRENGFGGMIKAVLTSQPIMEDGEFKVSRTKVRAKYLSGGFSIIDREHTDEHIAAALSDLEAEVAKCFAEALEKDAKEISVTASFFGELEGTSLDYYMLLGILKNKYSIELNESNMGKLLTVKDFCEYIRHS
jgi:acyl carrier protein